MTTETESKKYNGWTNYETWCVKLWMDNDERRQRCWERVTKELLEIAGEREEAVRLLAEELKRHHEDGGQDVLEEGKATCSVYAEMMRAAFSEVNWREIAEGLLEE